MATIIERRFVPLGGVELREEGGLLRFRGHAAIFNSLTDLGPFREQVALGTFKKTAKESDIRFLFNHEPDSVMARTTNGTLRLTEDKVGLATEADLDPTDWDVQRVTPKLRSGNVSQMSFAFRIVGEKGDEWDMEPEDGGSPIRTIREVQLFDVSAVTFPAYEETDAVLASVGRSSLEVAKRAGIECESCAEDLAQAYRESFAIECRGAIASHDTAVEEGAWDGPAAVAAMPNEARVLRYAHAWVDSEGDADAKSSYKFPHHRTLGGPAILPGVRNALARLSQANIPDGDRAGVERHLRRHLDAQEEDSAPPPDTSDEPDRNENAAELRRRRLEYLEKTLVGA